MTILNQTSVMETVFPSAWWFLVAVLPLLIGIVYFLIDGATDGEPVGIGFGCSLLSFLLIGFMLIIFSHEVPTDKNRYEVLIDSNYSVTQLYESYDMIERRGEIWVIEDK